VKKSHPHLLLINPWIHDFAAYDFWAKPLGLLQLAAIFRSNGARISYIDCLDRFHPRMKITPQLGRQGRGAYHKTKISNPPGLEDVPRQYSRYGIPISWFREELSKIQQPDLILVTSLMTYWYPGVQEAIKWAKAVFPDVSVILGGIYANLCRDHAQAHSGADVVISSSESDPVLEKLAKETGMDLASGFDCQSLDAYPYPAYDLQSQIAYIPLLTSRGCPYSCAYCASHFLCPGYQRRRVASVVAEIQHWHQTNGVVDFAFYDDALLVNADDHIIPILETLISLAMPIRFHTPNAMHAKAIDNDMAKLMARAGFETIRLGIETTEFENRKHLDHKVNQDDFINSVRALQKAGFNQKQIGAYILVGLPGQSISAVEETIQVVKSAGATPIMAHYSPIPHTALWEEAVAASRYDLESDPIFTNNAISPCQREPFSWQTLTRLKNRIAE
jgi:radical SAM superfamily enzyme YgiQ (UPF0313 family)